MLNLHLQERILRFRGLALDVLQFGTVLFWTGCLCGAVIREERIDERKTSTDNWTEAKGVNPSEVWTGTTKFQILRTRLPEGHKRHLLVGRQIPCLIHQHSDVSEVQGIASHCSDYINLALVNLISSLLIEAWEEILMEMHEIPNEQHLESHKFTQLDKLTAMANVLAHDQSTKSVLQRAEALHKAQHDGQEYFGSF